MRLINTTTRKVVEFHGNVPEYAILSHTWEQHELSLQDMQQPEPEKILGFEKVDRCCKLVAKEGFEYVWIDTCCIDKHSSSELSEAINSMYRWYKAAQVCITYLADVPSEEDPLPLGSSFATCKWFTRGWTLQELIAPPMIEFYGNNVDGDVCTYSSAIFSMSREIPLQTCLRRRNSQISVSSPDFVEKQC
jgi:hypothetical protein